MKDNNRLTQNLSVFGYNFSFIGNINLLADTEGNVYISNLGLESIFPQQATGDETANNDENLNSRQLLQFYSSSQRVFKQQVDGSYQGDGRTLNWNVDHYELDAVNGGKIILFQTSN